MQFGVFLRPDTPRDDFYRSTSLSGGEKCPQGIPTNSRTVGVSSPCAVYLTPFIWLNNLPIIHTHISGKCSRSRPDAPRTDKAYWKCFGVFCVLLLAGGRKSNESITSSLEKAGHGNMGARRTFWR